MAINKVVYGTTVLVDLTSDTVDAAHLAKGRTAHDAGGNLIVGTLEQQASGNLLSGVTPRLLNGATQSGKEYVIPSGGAYGTDYVEYQLGIPTLKSDVDYCLVAYGKTAQGYCSFIANLYFQNQDGTVNHTPVSGMFFNNAPSVQCASIKLASGAKPTKLVICGSGQESSLSVSNVTFMALDV